MDIFLGYPSEHRRDADEVYGHLVSLGHSVWMDKNALVGGVEWRRERELAQRNAKLVIHLCAEGMFSRSGDVHREIKLTLDLIEDQPLGSLFAVFVRLSDFRLPIELTRFQYIDKFHEDWRLQLEAVVERRGQQLSRTSQQIQEEVVREAPSIRGESELIEILDNEAPDQASVRYLRYNRDDLYWQFINSKISARALSGYFSAKRHFKESRTDVDPDWLKDQSFWWEFTTEEFFLSGNLLSLRFYGYEYFGGAHPNHYVESVNFAGPEVGVLKIHDLLSHDFKSARRIIDYCERVVSAYFDDQDETVTFHLLNKSDENQVWQALGQYNLDSRGVTFNFSPYVVMAYAFGTQTVFVPWEIMEGFLDAKGKYICEKFINAR